MILPNGSNLTIKLYYQTNYFDQNRNKAGYTAQDATFENNAGQTDDPTDRRTDTTSFTDATAHLKSQNKIEHVAPIIREF